MRSLKKMVEKVVARYPPLYALGSKAYHAINRSFKPGNPGAPAGVSRALRYAAEKRGRDIGDYYEFGIFKGYTYWWAQKVCGELGLEGPNFYAFDSFKGLPELEDIDKVIGDGIFFKGQFSCSRKQVTRFLEKNGVDWTRTHLIEGFYEDSLTEELREKYPFKRVAVALLDCDLHTSTIESMRWLAPYLEGGSIVLFDDWRAFSEESGAGQRSALKQFLSEIPSLSFEPLFEYEVHGQAFVVRKGRNDR
ncbi:MAG: TylF/MycF/NovP-related O-methyltransferase [Candidatus Omnitrophota bacterium]|nr:TylF/MycF/NovP-related O-methyltransferase [Candidatus Omnitrophota bacterium]